MVASIEGAMSAAQKTAADKAAGQGGLFLGGGATGAAKQGNKRAGEQGSKDGATGLVKVAPWTEAETLAQEKEALGFYVSSHPLTRWKQWASVFTTMTTQTARAAAHDQRAVLAGLVQGVRAIIVKNGRSAGQKMAIVTIEDELGTIETVLFADCYSQFAHLLTQDAVVFVLGRVDRSRAGMVIGRKKGAEGAAGGDDEEGAASSGGGGGAGASGNENVQVVVDRVVPIDGVPLMPGRMWLRVETDRLNGTGEAALRGVAEIVKASAAGGSQPVDKTQAFPVDIVVDTPEARIRLEVPTTTRVQPTPPVVAELTHLLGEGCVRVVGGVAVEVPGARPRWNGQKKAG
jgi:DNA polymerase-3 subunit alpha